MDRKKKKIVLVIDDSMLRNFNGPQLSKRREQDFKSKLLHS